MMAFRHFDNLRNALRVAEYSSLAEAAQALNQTKGALSQQIKRLESDLGFEIFERHSRGIRLTHRGEALFKVANGSFRNMENTIESLHFDTAKSLVIGSTTYFASRWLSSRLLDFMQNHPDIALRIQAMTEPYQLQTTEIDIAIRWGKGRWSGCELERLFLCPAWPSGSARHKKSIEKIGISTAMAQFTLLKDQPDSTVWEDWCQLAGLQLNYRNEPLVIADPNVRVQAVIDGQGIGINDALVQAELTRGELYRLHSLELTDYGYFLAYPEKSENKTQVQSFVSWIKSMAEDFLKIDKPELI